jgi:hypothetical protein
LDRAEIAEGFPAFSISTELARHGSG